MRTTFAPMLLPLVALLTLPAVAHAQFIFVTNNGAITITGYTGPSGDVTIPDTTNGLPVTSIGNNAFKAISSLTSATIPNTVTNLGNNCFQSCSNLTSVTFLNSSSKLGNSAFDRCTSLANVTLGHEHHQRRRLCVPKLHQPDHHRNPRQRHHHLRRKPCIL